ncbi:MAG: endo,4-beta-xylanase [Solirubrobacteraceae bacterium]|nr:endo,4-beta-xylanase [Solirubrobacteraceae bacterium]
MRLLATAAVLVGLLAAPATGAAATVPQGFFGMSVDGPMLSSTIDAGTQFGRMTAVGVESVISEVNWNVMQPDKDVAPDFARTDRIVLAAAARGMSVLENVLYAPAWAAVNPKNGASPPEPGPYSQFLRELIARYGPSGSLWTEHPEVPKIPVRDWQVWNEPTAKGFWSEQPYAKAYVQLLRQSHAAIKAADPGARVILAGLTFKSWKDLGTLYKTGAHGLFDAVSLHPYTLKVNDVKWIIKQNRDVMNAHGDRRLPILVTELSWPSAKGVTTQDYGYEQTEKGEAAKLREAFTKLAAARTRLGIQRVYWSTWLTKDTGHNTFDYSGVNKLRGGKIVAKPALAAYRQSALRLEGCKHKGATAARCG